MNKYDKISEYWEQRAMVRLNNRYGFIDQSGKEIVPLKRKWGFISESGEYVIRPQYDYFKWMDYGHEDPREYESTYSLMDKDDTTFYVSSGDWNVEWCRRIAVVETKDGDQYYIHQGGC